MSELQLWYDAPTGRIISVGLPDDVIGTDERGQPVVRPRYPELEADPDATRLMIPVREWAGDETTPAKSKREWHVDGRGKLAAGPPAETTTEREARRTAEFLDAHCIRDLVRALERALDGDRTAFDALAAKLAQIEGR